MHCRPMQDYDLRQVSKVAALAWAKDRRFGLTNPYSTQYPEDFRQSFLRRLQARTRLPGHHAFVCVADWRDADWLPDELTQKCSDKDDIILGYSLWIRYGSIDDPLVRPWYQKNSSMLAQLDQYLWSWERFYVETFRLDRSLDLAKERTYRRLALESDAFESLPDHFMLRALATHPAARRRGVGKQLMKWGMERAEEESCPVTLYASDDGMLLYVKLGFKVVQWSSFDLHDRRHTHSCMIWDWQGQYVREADPEEAAVSPDQNHKVDVVWRQGVRE